MRGVAGYQWERLMRKSARIMGLSMQALTPTEVTDASVQAASGVAPSAWFSRRGFLAAGASVFGPATAFARNRRLRSYDREKATNTRGGSVAAPPVDPVLLRLIDRTTFGYTRAAYNDAFALGYDAYVESQLAYSAIDDSLLNARLASFDTLTMSTEQIYTTYEMQPSVPALQLMESTVLRSVYSKRQLFERMVHFWTDHFSIDINKPQEVWFKTSDDRDVIRQFAMASFPELLTASAHSGAMLWYLDNYANIAGHAQENYARELMELHSLGVTGPYTEQDVQEVARCLTGWTFSGQVGGVPGLGEFVFDNNAHDSGTKTVLGVVIANTGEGDGQRVLDILSTHPATAQHISRKMCQWFLGYDAPDDIVGIVTDVYLNTGGDIKSMLRVILQRPVMEHWTTPKFKRPFHYTASLVRALGGEITSSRLIIDYLQRMGHVPFSWGPPDGYPDELDAWSKSPLFRWEFASDLLLLQIPGVTMDTDALLVEEGATLPLTQAPAVNRILTGGRLTASEVTSLQQFYDSDEPNGASLAARDMFGLAASVPTFQWY